MKIPLRTFQRNVQALLDTMAVNSAAWAEVIDGGGKVLFLAALPEVIETVSRQYKERTGGDSPVSYITTFTDDGKVATKDAKFLELKKSLDARANPDASIHSDMGYIIGEDAQLRNCDKCKKPSECRKWTEDGMDYKICEECAKKAKLQFNKLEKL